MIKYMHAYIRTRDLPDARPDERRLVPPVPALAVATAARAERGTAATASPAWGWVGKWMPWFWGKVG